MRNSLTALSLFFALLLTAVSPSKPMLCGAELSSCTPESPSSVTCCSSLKCHCDMSAPLHQAQHRQPATTGNTTSFETFKGLPAGSTMVYVAADRVLSVSPDSQVAWAQTSHSPLYVLTHSFLV